MESNIKTGFNPVTEFKKEWIETALNENGIIYLENFGFYLCDKNLNDRFPGQNSLTTSQMRNIFGEIKRIEANLDFPSETNTKEWEKAKKLFDDHKQKILLLFPKLAYNTARQLEKRRDSRIRQFREVLELALSSVKNQDQYKRFCQFVEGIVAYHKVYGGKEQSGRS